MQVLNGLMKKVIAIGKEDGIAALGKRMARWLLTRHRLLLSETVIGLALAAPADSFELENGHARIALQIHLFYLSLLDEMIEVTNRIPYRFDCYNFYGYTGEGRRYSSCICCEKPRCAVWW